MKRIDDLADGWSRPETPAVGGADLAEGTPAEVETPPSEPAATPATLPREPATTPATLPREPATTPATLPRQPAATPATLPLASKSTAAPTPAATPAPRRADPPPPPGSAERAKRDTGSSPAGKPGTGRPRPLSSQPPPIPADAKPRSARRSEPPPVPTPASGAAAPASSTVARVTTSPGPSTASHAAEASTRADSAPEEPPSSSEISRSHRRRRSSTSHPPAVAAESRAAEAARRAQKQSGSMLRLPTEIPERRGLLGAISYAVSASMSLRSCRRELDTVEGKLKKERDERRERLMELARHAIADPDVDASLVMRARDILNEIEDRRSRKAGLVAASETEIEAVQAERACAEAKHREDLAAVDREMADLMAELQPLERKLAETRNRGGELKAQIRLIDDRIRKVEADLVAARGATSAPVELEADLAALRAERHAVAAEEPELSRVITELEPEIAGVKASRAELTVRRDELLVAEKESRIRAEEKISAIRARRTVDDREVADVGRERNSALRELGETLHAERLPLLQPRLRGVDQHDEAIATLERRAIELKDKILRVDRATMWRGYALLGLVLVAACAATVAILTIV